MRIGDWFDQRLGYRDWFRETCDRPLPEGISWIRSLVFALIVLFILEGLTGFLLSLSYSPSTSAAHASVEYTIHETLLGEFVRSLHFHTSSLILVLITLIGLCCFYQGTYRKGNEISWILGVILLNLVFGYTITGFLLPWDQNALWGTKVRTSIMGSTPVVGPMLQKVVQGGNDIGNLTLTRFYTAHFFVLPLVTVGMYFLYRWIRRHLWRQKMETMSGSDLPYTYWPFQASRDVTTASVLVAVLFAAAWISPLHLGPPADPLLSYPARPEWFFRWLYQLLKYFDGPRQIIGTLVIPGAIGTILFLIPFVDRSGRVGFLAKKGLTLLLLLIGLFCGSLTGIAFYHDIESGHFEEVKLWEVEPDTTFDVKGFYKKECYECHGRKGNGLLEKIPDFSDPDYWSASRSDVPLIKAILEGVPNKDLPEDEQMPGFKDKINPAQAKALIEYKLKRFGRKKS